MRDNLYLCVVIYTDKLYKTQSSNMSSEIGVKIRKIREFRNYTQTHLADKLNISQNAYSKIENGTSKLSTDRLEEVAKILDVPVESFYTGEKQVFNLDNNHIEIEKFYGYIEHIQEENKEILQKTMQIMEQQSKFMQQQNEMLIKAIEAFTKKL